MAGLVLVTGARFGRKAEKCLRELVGRTLRTEPLGMFVQLCDLRLEALTVGAVFGRVDRLSLEGGVFRPKRIDFLPKPIVFRSYVFALAHLRIVACRQELCGISRIFAPDVRLMRFLKARCRYVISRPVFLRVLPWL